jgi:nuclear pore complex protein Nup98-Nup96
VASVADALTAYEEAFSAPDNAYAALPRPEYKRSQGELPLEAGEPLDLKFQLLRLYSQRSHPLEMLLSPATHTPDSLDFRLSWFVAQVLKALGYGHMAVQKDDELSISFADQLEAMDLWQWAVYVLLHLSNSFLRKAKILELLLRHVNTDDEVSQWSATCCLPSRLKIASFLQDSNERELFVRNSLGIPSEWIAQVRAMRGGARH